MNEKLSFMFYHNWKEQIELMTDVELRNFIYNCIRYDKNEAVVLNTDREKIFWLGIVIALETNKRNWYSKSENGKLGGAPVGNKNAVGKGAPVGNQNAIKNKQQNKQPKTNKQTTEQTTDFENSPSDILEQENIENKQPKTTETSVNSKELIVNSELETGNRGFSPSPDGGKNPIGPDTGPEEKIIDVSYIQTPSFINYGGLNDEGKNSIPTEEPKPTTPTRGPENAGPKNTEPTKERNNVPEFLKAGILIDSVRYFPLDGKIGSTGNLSELPKKQAIGKELMKQINNWKKNLDTLYQNNRNIIINNVLLTQWKDELSKLDYQELLDFLTDLDLPMEQKLKLKPSAKVIKQYINDNLYYLDATKFTRMKFGLK